MANFKIQNVRIQLKHDTADNWAKSSLTLMEGEMAIETDTKKFKIGDGSKTFAQLPYADADGIAAFVEGNAGKGKVIKTNDDGLLDDSFLKGFTVNQNTDDTSSATSVLTSATIDNKGRTSATTKMGIAAAGAADDANETAKAAVAKKLIQADDDGKLANSFLHAVAANTGDFTVANITVDAKGRVTAANSTPVTDVGGSGNNAKLVKTDDSGELADSFLKNKLATSGDTDAAGSYTMANITVDEKGRVTAISSSTPADLPIATDTTLGAVKAGAANNATDESKIDTVLVDANGAMSVAEVTKATRLSSDQMINATGDATGSVSFNGSATAELALTLATSGVTADSYTVSNITVDTKGRVTAASSTPVTAAGGSGNGEKLIQTDTSGELADSFLKTITRIEATTNNNATAVLAAVSTDTKGRVTGSTEIQAVTTSNGSADEGKLVKLNGVGKLDDSIIPALAIGEVHDYTSKAAAFNDIANVQSGDIAVITNTTTPTEDGVYICRGAKSPANFDAAYTLIKVPGTAIQTVNNKVGPNVVLSTGDIAEGPVITYVAATGTYVAGTKYYTDNTGSTEVDTSDFTAGTTDVSAYFVAQSGNTNMYFTTARVKDYTDTLSVRDTFTDGEHVMKDTDEYTFDCGTSGYVAHSGN